MKNVIGGILTILIWGVYAFGFCKAEEKFGKAWVTNLGALLFPFVICAIIAVNAYIGTSIIIPIFTAFIIVGIIWALSKMR